MTFNWGSQLTQRWDDQKGDNLSTALCTTYRDRNTSGNFHSRKISDGAQSPMFPKKVSWNFTLTNVLDNGGASDGGERGEQEDHEHNFFHSASCHSLTWQVSTKTTKIWNTTESLYHDLYTRNGTDISYTAVRCVRYNIFLCQICEMPDKP